MLEIRGIDRPVSAKKSPTNMQPAITHPKRQGQRVIKHQQVEQILMVYVCDRPCHKYIPPTPHLTTKMKFIIHFFPENLG
jgi:hypothetical protein